MSSAPRPIVQAQTEAERIVAAYLKAAHGNLEAAILCVVEDALSDLSEAERRTMNRDRLISRGYVRGGSATAADRA